MHYSIFTTFLITLYYRESLVPEEDSAGDRIDLKESVDAVRRSTNINLLFQETASLPEDFFAKQFEEAVKVYMDFKPELYYLCNQEFSGTFAYVCNICPIFQTIPGG